MSEADMKLKVAPPHLGAHARCRHRGVERNCVEIPVQRQRPADTGEATDGN